MIRIEQIKMKTSHKSRLKKGRAHSWRFEEITGMRLSSYYRCS